jgi:gliding motility-associated-like protein
MSLIFMLSFDRGKFWPIIAVMICLSFQAYSQACECPSAGSCGTCIGGLSSLTLKYNGPSTASVVISDLLGEVYNQSVAPGASFTFNGSLPPQKFIGDAVTIKVNGSVNATINTSCSVQIYVGQVAGDFTVVTGSSVLGVAMCCSPSGREAIAPVFSGCPGNMTVAVSSGSCTVPVTWTAPTASDECGISSLTSTHAPGASFSLGTTTVTYTATDGAGNSSTCSFNVTVVDNTLPLISDCPSNITVSTTSSCSAPVTWTAPIPSDNCTVSMTSTHAPGATFPVGTTQVKYTATDGSGNSSTCSFNVTVVDSGNPVISGCPSNITVSAGVSCFATATWSPLQVTDNCTVTMTGTHSPGSSFPIGTTQVKYTATDISGNSSVCTFNVTVVDNTNPVITSCPSDITLSAGESCAATATWTPPQATDNCSVTLTSTHTPGASFPLGTTQVKYTATDGSGNTATCAFNVTVLDNTNPVITGCPSNITVSANASCTATATWIVPQATDNCSVTLTSTHSPGSTFGLGTTQVKYTATDGIGNSSTCSFNVTVVDNTNPVITGCPSNITVSANSSCTATATWTIPQATDNCSVTLTSTHSPGSTFVLGTTQVKYTATDGTGNSSTCTFNVTVVDNTNPVITACPSNITVSANASCTATATWTAPQATDNCSVTMTSTHSPGSIFALGTTQVKYTATDGAGNSSTCTFNVTVIDTTNPVIANYPANITLSANAACSATATWTAPQATDNCSVTMTSTHLPGSTFALGTTEVKYTAIDAAGNSSTCAFNVTVVDNTAPVITNCPANITLSANASCTATGTWITPTATDNCSVTMTATHVSGSNFTLGTTQVKYTATDGAGNSSTCTFNVMVVDDTNPVITGCPSDITLPASGSCTAQASWTPPQVTDNCSVATMVSSHNPGDNFPLGTTEVKYIATDASGNSSICVFHVIVTDNVAPVLTGLPIDITVSAIACEMPITWVPPTVSDNCSVTVSSTHSPGDSFPIGDTKVTYAAIDDSGNSTVTSFWIHVLDNTNPQIAGIPSDITVVASAGACVYPVSWQEVVATDNCEVILTSTHSSGDAFPLGVSKVTYTATDQAGNIVTREFNVTVQADAQTILPTFTDCPAAITVTAGIDGQALVSWVEPAFSNPCELYTISSSHLPGTSFQVGTTEVIYTANANHHTTTCNFSVIVEERPSVFNVVKFFTPDGDGVNDKWMIENITLFKVHKILVVDRWGGVVFESNNYDNDQVAWNGQNRQGKEAPTGTYFYTITAEAKGGKIEKKGFLELVR